MIYLLAIYLIYTTETSHAQSGSNLFRSQDDYTYLLQSDSNTYKFYEAIKYIPLFHKQNVNLSIGGELREQYQYFKNANFGDLPPDTEADQNGHIWHRAMLHTHIRIKHIWEVFVQFNSSFAFGKNAITPQVDEDALALHQAFMQWNTENNPHFFVRIGRQELTFISPDLIAVREMPNNRLSFDGIVLGLEKDHVSCYAFAVTPRISETAVFDNSYISEYLWSFYSKFKFKHFNVDLFYLGFYNEQNAYNYITGIEQRQSIGFGLNNRPNVGLNYEMLAVLQLGNFGDNKIRAFYLSTNLTYPIKLGNGELTPGISISSTSGDRTSTDNILNTYNMLYSRPSFGLSLPIGPSNINSIGQYISYTPNASLRVTMSNFFIWRFNKNDGIYTPGRVQTRPDRGASIQINDRYIGQQLNIKFEYSASTNWRFSMDFSKILPGAFIEGTGHGKSITYLSGKMTFIF